MDQDLLVTEQTEQGEELIKALDAKGFEVRVAYWAKPTEDAKWFLYLASPYVDLHGTGKAYRFVYAVLRETPGLEFPMEIRVVRTDDSTASAALELMKPKVPVSPFAVSNPSRFPVRYGGSKLGGLDIEGAYVYRPPAAATT
jgi:hypothetical protein